MARGLESNLARVARRGRELEAPDFTNLDPRERVPVLKDGDFVLTQSIPFCRLDRLARMD